MALRRATDPSNILAFSDKEELQTKNRVYPEVGFTDYLTLRCILPMHATMKSREDLGRFSSQNLINKSTNFFYYELCAINIILVGNFDFELSHL